MPECEEKQCSVCDAFNEKQIKLRIGRLNASIKSIVKSENFVENLDGKMKRGITLMRKFS